MALDRRRLGLFVLFVLSLIAFGLAVWAALVTLFS
jgi:hypothetical protein